MFDPEPVDWTADGFDNSDQYVTPLIINTLRNLKDKDQPEQIREIACVLALIVSKRAGYLDQRFRDTTEGQKYVGSHLEELLKVAEQALASNSLRSFRRLGEIKTVTLPRET